MPATPPAEPNPLTPDNLTRVPRPDAPAADRPRVSAVTQTSDNSVYHLRGNAIIEMSDMVLKADEIDYNEDTGYAEARGHVFYQNFEQGEKIVCDKVEYWMDEERGKYYNVRGYSKARIDTRPGILTSTNPFYFEAKWAERIGEKYILHDGMITACKMPNPWWTLRGPKFDIIPGQRALAYKAVYRLKKAPLFYTPFFYKSLEKEPRKSGFLMPNIGNSSRRGPMFGLGYYWAINRSYDATYIFQDFVSRGYAHHVDFRGKPFQGTDFDVIFYGVQDRGLVQGNTVTKYGGYDVVANGISNLGDGWVARGQISYLSSLGFHQQFTESFTEAIASESSSSGFISKHVDSYSFNVLASRTQLFQDLTPGNYIIIRKLPELNLSGRDQEVSTAVLPLWFSFDSEAGLLHRSEPSSPAGDDYSTRQFMPRVNLAPRLMTRIEWQGFSLTPSITLHETYFADTLLNGRLNPSGLNRFANEEGLELTLPSLEKIFDRKTIFGDKLKHVIETRATFKHVSGVENFQELIRFDDLELLNNTSEADISVINRVYAKRGDNVSEIFTWSLTQRRYFDPTFGGVLQTGQRNVLESSIDLTPYAFLDRARSVSPLISQLHVSPVNGFGLEWRADYDPVRGGIVDSSFTADYRHLKYFLSAGNTEVRSVPTLSPPANEFRTLFGYGDANRRGWNLAAQADYDYRTSILRFASTQVTYNTDCCGFSVQYRRLSFGAVNDNQYRLAFTIANVGSFGTLKKQERLF